MTDYITNFNYANSTLYISYNSVNFLCVQFEHVMQQTNKKLIKTEHLIVTKIVIYDFLFKLKQLSK